MNIFELAEAIKAAEAAGTSVTGNHSILIYGPPRVGKTRLAASIARAVGVNTMHWFDLENGADTIVAMALQGIISMEDAKKIILYKIRDLPDQPVAMDTILKCIVNGKERFLCLTHGRVECPACLKLFPKKDDKKGWYPPFNIDKLGSKDWVVIDTGTQLGISMINYLMKGSGYEVKPGWDEYGPQGRMLSDVCTTIQAAANCNFIMITHQMILDEKDKFVEGKMIPKEQEQAQFGGIYPLLGTKQFSVNCAKYFGHIIYCHMNNLSKHAAGSSSTYKNGVITGSRSGLVIEKESTPDLSLVFSKLALSSRKDGEEKK